jgi:CheY-like chemotaxis protein
MHIAAKDPDPMANWSQSSSPGMNEPKASFCDLSKVPPEEMRVCIAEDNAINRKIAISFVNKLGYSCEAFEDGKLAYEALQKRSKEAKPFHLVLMDCQMPVLDGYEAAQAIRKDPDVNVREVLIIAMTASAIRGDREKCLEAGMNDYLAKPVRQAALKSMLNEYIHNPQAAIKRAAAETADADSNAKTNGEAKNNGHTRRPPFVSKKSGLSNATNLSVNSSPSSGRIETGEDVNGDGAMDRVRQKLVSIKDAAEREAKGDSSNGNGKVVNGEASTSRSAAGV